MQSVQINLFDLFYEVAEKFAQRLSLNTSSEHVELGLLKQAYYGSIAIDYSSPIRKYVYLKTYAPRHALIWRIYMRLKKPWTMDGRTGWRFNSIGTGPAAEVIGVLESGDWADKSPKVEVACLENEESWYGIGEIVSELYTAKSRRHCSSSTLNPRSICLGVASSLVQWLYLIWRDKG